MLTLTKLPYHAAAITHGGSFHADDVMSTVIIQVFLEAEGRDDLILCRMNKYDQTLHDPAALVYDIGGGRWDHHQRGGNGARENGVPYSSCGLIWRDLGMKICRKTSITNPNLLWLQIDKELIQPIDAVDCGAMPRSEYPTQPFTFSSIISAWNPNWDENLDTDTAFVEACKLAYDVFDNILSRALAKIKASEHVYACLSKMEGHILVLDNYMPWIDQILNPDEFYAEKAAEVLFVVCPAMRGGYQWRAVPDRLGSYGMRKPAPSHWWGYSGRDLQRLAGVDTATFCHPNGFIGGADTLEDAILMAKKAVEY